MYWPLIVLLTVVFSPAITRADDEPPAIPGFNERLNQALGSEGGVQVYMDREGMVGTLIDPPGGERTFMVQPQPSPSINLGPPLQLHNPLSQLPLPSPAQPAAPTKQRDPH
jgi:hypothetical protein